MYTKEIRQKLIEQARLGATISYSQLNEQLELNLNFDFEYDRSLIGQWLGEISVHEYDRERPLLSALVIHKHGGEQGDGFYKLCEELYGTPWQDMKADKSIENEIIEDCYSFWKDNDNCKNFRNDY